MGMRNILTQKSFLSATHSHFNLENPMATVLPLRIRKHSADDSSLLKQEASFAGLRYYLYGSYFPSFCMGNIVAKNKKALEQVCWTA